MLRFASRVGVSSLEGVSNSVPLDGGNKVPKRGIGRPKGSKDTKPRKKKGYKTRSPKGYTAHPLYKRLNKRGGVREKTIPKRTKPRQLLPGPKHKIFGYQFEYKHSTRLFYVKNPKGSITREQQAHHARAAAPYIVPIVEGYLLTWAILPGYCRSTGIPEEILRPLILIRAFTTATGRRSFTYMEMQQYLRWYHPPHLATVLEELERLGYIMFIAAAVERPTIIKSIRAGAQVNRKFTTTTLCDDLLLTLYDYTEQIRANWNADTSPIDYVDSIDDIPKLW